MADSAAMYRSLLAALSGLALLVALVPAAGAAPSGGGTKAKEEKKDKPTPRACPRDKVWNETRGGCICAPPSTWDDATRKCVVDGAPVLPPAASAPSEPSPVAGRPDPTAPATRPLCASSQEWSDAHQRCIVRCPPNQFADAKGKTCLTIPKTCTPGSEWSDEHESCVPICPGGKVLDANAVCVDPRDGADTTTSCPAGTERVVATKPGREGPCVPLCPAGTRRVGKGRGICAADPKECPEGREWKDAWNACVPACPAGQVLDFKGYACHPIRRTR